MRKSTLAILSVFLLAIITTGQVSASYSHLSQSTTTSERWYGVHKTGYDMFPSDVIIDHVYYDQFYKYPRIERDYVYHRVQPFRRHVLANKFIFKHNVYF